ncbi:hypothetical protein Acr_16g0003960 [Actinidia rufa]|uniref:Uncharacterized protein n=1 Tax=Actinidia rufa TaxID=165716 RepID=A0A7J0FYI8_9ERIC|nr:hypothetical protein Acr_16g0003960 [Actinidia rufa]
MSSLQHRVRSNDAAREEILRDRKAAIESGKLKGRLLFGPVEGGSEVGFEEREEVCSEVRSVCSYECGDDNEDCGERGGRRGWWVNYGEVDREEECGGGNGGGRGMFFMGWLAFALLVLTMGIIYKRCNHGGYGDEDEVMLVPT